MPRPFHMQDLSYPSYRSVNPEETLHNIQPHLSKMGITRVANITGLDEVGIPVYIATRPNSRSLSLSQGKGLTSINAKVSAIMETVESYHGENIDLPVVVFPVSRASLQNASICEWQSLPAFKGRFLDEDKNIEWIKGVELLSGKEMHVPYVSVHVDMTVTKASSEPYFIQTSSGLASGNNKQEAINHAICELLERDSYACWSVISPKKRFQTKVDLESIDCDVCIHLIERLYNAGIHIGIWNITSDSGIPAFLVRLLPMARPPSCTVPPSSGFGCHPDKNLSLIRALTEAAQSRLTFIAGARDDIRLSHFRSFGNVDEYERWYQAICAQESLTNYSEIAFYKVDDADAIWETLRRSLVSLNINQIISVDLTKDEFGISVVKVVIPRLEGSESYDVMELGVRAKNTLSKEEELVRYA